MKDYPILQQLNGPADLQALPEEKLPALAEEVRGYMVDCVSKNGGHLAASLGAVDLIIALHRVYTDEKDRLIFDVGHQAYAHKILTGRRDAFADLRQEGGISGFPKREESPYDAFNTGHASTSISAALGMVRAKNLLHEAGHVAAVIGDGALTGGLAYEALDDGGDSKLPLVVVLNDNEMSISRNVGAMSRSLSRLRASSGYNRLKRFVVRALETGTVGRRMSKNLEGFKNRIKRFVLQNTFFEEMGFTYLGPIDGHDIPQMIALLREAKALERPVVVHVITQKGKGYSLSERNPEKFHGIAPFSPETGAVAASGAPSCSQVFGETVLELGKEDECIVAITAAMRDGTGLRPFFDAFPDRAFDVGIAEEHALTMAAGMAAEGLKPVAAIYSSFLQRAVDQLCHDICLQKLPVVVGVDRAGLVGQDGETHQGIYDPALLCAIPNLSVYEPATLAELRAMVRLAVERGEPAAIRYCRGTLPEGGDEEPVTYGKWVTLRPASDVVIVAAGPLVEIARQVAEEQDCGLVEARFYKPLDYALLDDLRKRGCKLVVAEENVAALSLYVAAYCPELVVRPLCLPDGPMPQATVARQRTLGGVDAAAMAQAVRELRGIHG
ncbi:MAG: 1-deoxy-D-xylulose-5-phosphate synthase [Clostridia bacterium]|nr:1-deoxy-D-xylulose-5-phosphate synthase [Clostridia bacterium]